MKKLVKTSINSEFILLCDYAFIGEGGKLCVIGKFETIFVRELPSGHPEFFIVGHFSGEPNSVHEVNVQITDPRNNDMIRGDASSFKLQLSPYGTGNFIHRLFNFPINNAGEYIVSFDTHGKQIGTSKVLVIRIKEQDKSQLN